MVQLAERKEAKRQPDRLREIYRHVVRKAVEDLRDISFVPVRERQGHLTIVMDLAIDEDTDALRRVKEVEQEAMIQAALAGARERMLARLRNPNEHLGNLDDRRYKGAVRAAHKDPDTVSLMLARPSSTVGTDIAKLRAAIRATSDRDRRDEQNPQDLDDNDALFQALIAKRSGKIER